MLYLFLEQWYYRTVTTQHISETGSYKLSIVNHLRILSQSVMGFTTQLAVQALHIYLTDTLTATHYIGWVHSLIRRYHHEFLHTILHTYISNHLRSVNIIQHRLTWVILHHRHMLICSCMEHIIWSVPVEQSIHSGYTADAGHNHICIYIREFPCHHKTDIMLRGFCLVYQNHLLWFERSYLTNHLRTDTACRTGNQYAFILQQFCHRLQVDIYLSTWKQIFYRHLLQGHAVIIIRNHSTFYLCFSSTPGHEYLYSRIDKKVLQLLIITEVICTWSRNKQGFDIFLLDYLQQIVVHTIHILPHQLDM